MKFWQIFRKKCPFQINDFVIWDNGQIQWTESRRVVHIEYLEEWWIFVDGSMTGIPASQLKHEENRNKVRECAPELYDSMEKAGMFKK